MASNPVFVACNADVWTLVAANVTDGVIWLALNDPRRYLQAYRTTGSPAPAGPADGIPIPGPCLSIEADTPIDCYIMAQSHAGRVRVDL